MPLTIDCHLFACNESTPNSGLIQSPFPPPSSPFPFEVVSFPISTHSVLSYWTIQ